MKNLLLLSPLFTCLCFLFSCKKDDGPASNTELLTAHCWKITAASIDPALNGSTDYHKLFPSCEKDNIYCFKADGTSSVDEGPSKCLPSNPQTHPGAKWAFDKNETILRFTDSDGEVHPLDLLELSAALLKVGERSGGRYAVYTYTPQ